MSGAADLISRCEALLAPRVEQRIVPGLDRIRAALQRLGHPERRFPSAVIVGTNGKGSTAALLASIARAHGCRTGLYTSPHLVRVTERIRLDGREIPPARLLHHLETLEPDTSLSYFETLTAAAFLEFASMRVDVAVLEAGLGGRWDAVNAADPTVSLLTNIGTDHTQWLGATRPLIAAEKAAALRGRDAIVGRWDDEVEATIRVTADPAARLSTAAEWVTVTTTSESAGARLDGAGRPVAIVADGLAVSANLRLHGAYQLDNLALAVSGALALARHGVLPPLRADALARAVERTEWPGRLEWVDWRGRRLLLDGAHNRESVRAVAEAVREAGLSGEIDVLFSCLDDKPLAEMARVLGPLARTVTVTTLDSPRASGIASLRAAFPGCRTAPDVAAALACLSPDRPTLVIGSLRLIGEVVSLIRDASDDPGPVRSGGAGG